jgi:ABC-type uncharacterized transport system fused permease/ATPase subunit
LSAFGVPEKVIQSLVSAFSAVECSVLAEIATAMVHWIVNWAVAGRLLRSVVGTVATLRVTIVCLAGMHLGAMIIVASCGSCKILQVSDHYSFVRRMNGVQPVLLFYIPFPP